MLAKRFEFAASLEQSGAILAEGGSRIELARAEHGCFVGDSLTVRPRLVWRVNGAHVEVAA